MRAPNPVRYLFRAVATWLAGLGLVDDRRGRRIADLAWPRTLTMFARQSQQVADAAMVGLAIGPAAIAGLALAAVYWSIANAFTLGLVGGTVNQVSQRFGAERFDRLDLAVKQSVWVGLALAAPFVVAYALLPERLVALFGAGGATAEYGGAYLGIIAVALLFNALNAIAARVLAGADDTWISMVIRATGATANIVFNLVFIFGLGMGVAGAALGTVLAEVLVLACFGWGLLRGSLPLVGAFPVRLSLGPPYFDRELSTRLLVISVPLMADKLARAAARYPLFALLAVFGPTVVAAFEVGRRIRNLIRSTGNGFKMSASAVVGQELGRDDEPEAEAYARDTLVYSAVIYLGLGGLAIAFAGPLATVFTDDPATVAWTVPFIRVSGLSSVGIGINYSYMGVLQAAGDNTWSMYGRLVGQYLMLLPLVFVGTVTGVGVAAVYLGVVLETWAPAAITAHRVHSGRWLAVSRRDRPGAASD